MKKSKRKLKNTLTQKAKHIHKKSMGCTKAVSIGKFTALQGFLRKQEKCH